MKGFLLGVIVTVVAGAAVVFLYFQQGLAPVATAAPPMPFEKTLARLALRARLGKEMPKAAPIEASEPNLVAGAHLYVENCAVCHGLPGKSQTAIARGEFPKPPHLFDGHGVTDDPPGATYWRTANGIRLTGMPAFDKSLTETQIWQVSLLLANADKLPASATAVLAAPPAPLAAP
ncbi:MAG TPA: cytochrome c [Vicinamibacteria bacterium]|nr:cytochrome c [Vicinamibacteria bacterium]